MKAFEVREPGAYEWQDKSGERLLIVHGAETHEELNAMNINEKLLADVAIPTIDRKEMVYAISVVLLVLLTGLLSTINVWFVLGIAALVASGFAVMLWPASKDEKAAVTWWNGLSLAEREMWLSRSSSGQHRDAWETYKRSATNA